MPNGIVTQDQLGDTAFTLGQQRAAEVVQRRVDALFEDVFEAPGAAVQPGEVLAEHRQHPGRDAREQRTGLPIELVGERQRNRQALPGRDLQDVVELILQVRVPVERLVVKALGSINEVKYYNFKEFYKKLLEKEFNPNKIIRQN